MIEDQIGLSFRDLIELRFVQAFLAVGISLQAIRVCLAHAKAELQSDRPFASRRFKTDGRTIFLESLEHAGDPHMLDLRKKQYVMKDVIEQSFKDLDLEDDEVMRWRPFRGRDSIVLDPKRSFGQPIASRSGVPTIVLADSVVAEGSVARVSAIFEVDKSSVADSVEFEKELMNR
jgi:uncharacterized protein (DUF433 family)